MGFQVSLVDALSRTSKCDLVPSNFRCRWDFSLWCEAGERAGEGEFGCGKLESQVCLAGANAGGALRNAMRCNRSDDAGKEGGGKEEERWK